MGAFSGPQGVYLLPGQHFSAGGDFAPGDSWFCLETILVVTLRQLDPQKKSMCVCVHIVTINFTDTKDV